MAVHFSDDTMQESLKRFSYHDGNIVFAELLTHAYDDLQTEVTARVIVEFDVAGNVIKAEPDADLDGEMDQVNQFTYANNNLVSANLYKGTVITVEYSSVLNNFSTLNDNIFGSMLSRLLYAWTYGSDQYHPISIHSRHLATTELSQTNYEIWNNGYYKKCSRKTELPSGRLNSVIEFYFN